MHDQSLKVKINNPTEFQTSQDFEPKNFKQANGAAEVRSFHTWNERSMKDH